MPTMPDSPVNFCTPSQYDSCADKALDELVAKDNDVCVCKTLAMGVSTLIIQPRSEMLI